jgi:hypothetical protein
MHVRARESEHVASSAKACPASCVVLYSALASVRAREGVGVQTMLRTRFSFSRPAGASTSRAPVSRARASPRSPSDSSGVAITRRPLKRTFSIVILGPGHQAIVSHEALVCTLGSAAVETAVDSTSRLDSSTVLRRGKSRNPSILSYLKERE